jgi:hypothetical protein
MINIEDLDVFGCLDVKEQANMLEISPDGDYAVISTTKFDSNH